MERTGERTRDIRFYSALIGYIWYEAEPEERNFTIGWQLVTNRHQSR